MVLNFKMCFWPRYLMLKSGYSACKRSQALFIRILIITQYGFKKNFIYTKGPNGYTSLSDQ